MNVVVSAIINGLVASALTTALVYVLLRLLPRNVLNAATRYWIWWATMAIAIILPLFFIHVPVNQPRPSIPSSAAPVAPVLVADPQTSSSHFAARPPVVAPKASQGNVLPATGTRRVRMPAFPIEMPAARWPISILAIWPAVALLLLIRLFVSFFLLYRIRTRAFDVSGTLAERIQQWIRDCGAPVRAVSLKASRDIGTPVAIGPWRPCVLIPEGLFSELNPAELIQVGLHEAAHFARRDDYALILQRCIEAMFALHPVVRWVARQLDLEREMACDDLVIASTGNPGSYAACLVRIVEWSGGVRSAVAAIAAAEDSSHLVQRVDVLLDKSRHPGTRLLKLRLIAILGITAVLALAAQRVSDLVAFAQPIAPHATPMPPSQAAKVTLLPQQVTERNTPPEGIAGRVLEDSSGNPLASAELRFHKVGMYELAADLETDRQGRFTAPDLPTGDYTVDALKSNYVTTTFKLHVPSGSPLIRLVRYGVIDGQAMDSEGKPLPGRILDPGGRTRGSTRITVLVRHPGSEEMQLFREMAVEDAGHYRIFDLPPGEYAIGIWYSGLNEGSGVQLYPDNSHPRFFSVSGGEEYNNINFVVVARPAWGVSGRITLPEGVTGRFQLALGLPDQPMLPVSQTLSERDGSFHFDKVPAGSYDLFAAGPTNGYTAFESILGPGEPWFGHTRIDVSAQNVEGLNVAVGAGRTVKVRLQTAGGDRLPEGCPAKAEVSLMPLEPWGILFTSRTQIEFGKEQTIPNLAPGRFRLTAVDLSATCFQVKRPTVDLSAAETEPVAIEIASAGSIKGLIKNGGGTAAVVLMPSAATDGAGARVAFPDTDGQFGFQSLPPGRYRIAAQSSAEARARWFPVSGGREIDVTGGESTNIELDAPKEGSRP